MYQINQDPTVTIIFYISAISAIISYVVSKSLRIPFYRIGLFLTLFVLALGFALFPNITCYVEGQKFFCFDYFGELSKSNLSANYMSNVLFVLMFSIFVTGIALYWVTLIALHFIVYVGEVVSKTE